MIYPDSAPAASLRRRGPAATAQGAHCCGRQVPERASHGELTAQIDETGTRRLVCITLSACVRPGFLPAAVYNPLESLSVASTCIKQWHSSTGGCVDREVVKRKHPQRD